MLAVVDVLSPGQHVRRSPAAQVGPLFEQTHAVAGVSQRDAVRVFEKLGYRVARQSGHIVMSNGKVRLIIPRHNPINAITMGAIARDAGLSPEQFRELL